MQKHGHFLKEYSSLQHNFLILYFFFAVLGLHCVARAFSWCGEQGLLFSVRMNLSLLGEGIFREFGMSMCTLPYLKWITSKDLVYSTGNSLSVMWQPGWEGSLGETGYLYM